MATVLKIENLHKSFKLGFLLKKKEILRGISLSVEQGEVFGYLGPNGAGKTTTIKCILGLIFPEKGNIEIDVEEDMIGKVLINVFFLLVCIEIGFKTKEKR